MRKGQKLPTGQSEDIYKRLDECIKSYCGLIFNPYAALEWVEGKATTESISRIAAVVDSAKFKYVLEADYLIYTRELLDQISKQNANIYVPDFPIIQRISDNCIPTSALGVLVAQVPDYLEENQRKKFGQKGQIPIKVPELSVREWVEQTFRWKKENPETYKSRVDNFKTSLLEDITRKGEYYADRQRYRRDWIKRLLKIDRILKAFNPGVDVDSVLDNTDITNCSSIQLYWKVREKRMEYNNPPKDTDVGDYIFLSGVPYADIILLENKMRNLILKADNSLKVKVFYKAADALKAIKNQAFTC